MSNKRYEVKTVKNYIGKTYTGPLMASVGYSMKEGWTNPNKNKLMKKAGFFTVKDLK